MVDNNTGITFVHEVEPVAMLPQFAVQPQYMSGINAAEKQVGRSSTNSLNHSGDDIAGNSFRSYANEAGA